MDFGYLFITILFLAIALWAIRRFLTIFSWLFAIGIVALLVIYLLDAAAAFNPATYTFTRPLLIQDHLHLAADWLSAVITLLFPDL